MGDTDAANVAEGQGEYVWFSDDELGAFLALNNADPRRAAVAALRIVAMTPALKLRKWTSADLQVDGAAITTALLDLIEGIEKGIDKTDAASGYFHIATEDCPVPIWDQPGPIGQAGPPYLVPGFPYGML